MGERGLVEGEGLEAQLQPCLAHARLLQLALQHRCPALRPPKSCFAKPGSRLAVCGWGFRAGFGVEVGARRSAQSAGDQ